MIYGSPVKSSYLDINTGNELSELKNFIYLVNHIDNIGIGYKVKKSANVTDELEGLDLNNGKILWKRDLKKDFGWNDHFYINDTTILIVSSGLHSINLRTGNGWDYNTITGEKDYTKNIAANAAGIALGLLTGVYVFTFGDNTVFDLASNTLVDSSHLYFASKEQLVKIDKQSGEIAWKYPFYGDFTSKSSIFTIGNHIFMVNLGRAFVRGKSIDFGKPFFASFDKQTGKEIFISVIEMKDNPILNFSISHDEIFLIFKDRIKKYSLETGSEIKEKEFPKDTFGELRYLVGNHVYTITEDNTVSNLLKSDSTKVFIITSQDKILSVDNDLNVAKTINIKDINICYAQTKHLKFIAKDDYTLVINNEGTTIAEIGASTNAVIKGKTLYDFKDDKFISIDLQRLFTDKN
jgi:hypothetical protein